LALVRGRVAARYAFSVVGGRSGERVRLTVSAHVVTESGGNENATPAAADLPEFLGWEGAKGLSLDSGLIVNLPMDGEAVAVFTQPRDAAIRASAQLTEVDYANN